MQPIGDAFGMVNVGTRQSDHLVVEVVSENKEKVRKGGKSIRRPMPARTYSSKQIQHSRFEGSTRSSVVTEIMGSCLRAAVEAGGGPVGGCGCCGIGK